jgi:LacI family transcriptional regulator
MIRSQGTMMQDEPQQQIAVLISPDWPRAAASLAGIMDYAEKKKGWHILNLPPGFTGGPEALWDFEADGALAYVGTEAEADAFRRRKLPVVSLGSALLKPGIVPRVILDNDAVGREAASHFTERRFRRLGLICSEGSLDADFRRRGFIGAAAEADVSVDVLALPTSFDSWDGWQAAISRLEEWLGGLTYPVGIATSNDTQAREVLQACRNLDLRVPDDVAVLGVGNNERICTYAKPKISSVAIPGHKIGFQAAQLLDRLIEGEAVPDADILVPPAKVVSRRSSRTLGIDNAHVLKVVSHINVNAGDAFGVEHLVSMVPVSRVHWKPFFVRTWIVHHTSTSAESVLKKRRRFSNRNSEKSYKRSRLNAAFRAASTCARSSKPTPVKSPKIIAARKYRRSMHSPWPDALSGFVASICPALQGSTELATRPAWSRTP